MHGFSVPSPRATSGISGAPAVASRSDRPLSRAACRASLSTVRRTGSTAMPPSKLAWVLERARATEHGEPGRGCLFSESVLVVDRPRIYDQEGKLRATIKSSSDNDSFARRVFSRAPRVRKVVDVNDQILLTFEIGYRTFRSIATNGTEIAKIVIPPGSKRKKACPIEAAGETVGSLCHGDRHGDFSVRDTDDMEIARISTSRPDLARCGTQLGATSSRLMTECRTHCVRCFSQPAPAYST